MKTSKSHLSIATWNSTVSYRAVVKKSISVVVALLIVCVNLASTIAHAQSVFDVNPPVITLDELNNGIAGETQIFTALVTDDNNVQDVKLYYRFSGQVPFQFIEMQSIADSNYYSANLPTDPDEVRSIEYYLQARDNGGNRVVRGFAFEPLVRTLSASSATAPAQTPDYPAGAAPTSSNESQSGGFKWWYVVLGLLAAGAAVGLAGGDDSGGSTSNPNLVPINVTVSTPQ